MQIHTLKENVNWQYKQMKPNFRYKYKPIYKSHEVSHIKNWFIIMHDLKKSLIPQKAFALFKTIEQSYKDLGASKYLIIDKYRL